MSILPDRTSYCEHDTITPRRLPGVRGPAPGRAPRWDRLCEGGSEGPCGWLEDRFGLSWQVVPAGMDELFGDPDRSRATRAMQAMLGMRKLDLAALRAAADGAPVS
jgi:hypothetical protein